MLTFERLDATSFDWNALNDFAGRTPFQTRAWMEFLVNTQGGEPLIAVLHDRGVVAGYFIGMIVRKFGLKLLGSPFPGWTTPSMGFVLREGIDRVDAAQTLPLFVFKDLGCVHFELMDRHLEPGALGVPFQYRAMSGFELNLTHAEDALFTNFSRNYRRDIRNAMDRGIVVEECTDPGFADDFYAHLRVVFARQRLVPTYDLHRVRELIRCLLPEDMVLLLRARDAAGRCIATNISIGMNDRSYSWGAAMDYYYQSMKPNPLLQWHALRYWKSRGSKIHDFNGSGDYKRKYGGYEIRVGWFRASKYPVLSLLRDGARRVVALKQHIAGHHPGALPQAPGISACAPSNEDAPPVGSKTAAGRV